VTTWRTAIAAAVFALLAAACGSEAASGTGPPLPEISPAELEGVLAASGQPAVVNVWASWCLPCRSEAPLLRAADEALGEEVTFIGVAVADRQGPARDFLDEFGLTFDNYFDPERRVPGALGRTGVPITFFFDASGDLVHAHSGVIDERTLAINLDELLAR